jgi:MFS family permease
LNNLVNAENENLIIGSKIATPLVRDPSVLEPGHSSAWVRRHQLSEVSIIVITSLAHAVCHIGELVFAGVMLAVMVEFDLKPAEATTLALLGYVLMGAGALPVGFWADAWGPARVLLIYLLAMAFCAVAVALAPNLWLLFLALTGLGLAASIYHPAGLALISLGVKARGRAMGINGVAGSIGVATGPLLGMLAAAYGVWRLAYVILAGLALVCAGMLYLACRISSQDETTLEELPPSLPPILQKATRLPQRPATTWPLLCLFGAMLLGGLNYRCLVTALPPFLSVERTSGAALAQAGGFVFFVLIAGGIGQFFGGFAADALGARRIYPVLIGLLALCALLLGSLEAAPLALPVACSLAVFLFAQQPVENSLLAEWTSARRRSISYGTKFALTFGVGALGAPLVGLVWEESGSVAPAFSVLALSATLMALLSLGVLRRRAPEF